MTKKAKKVYVVTLGQLIVYASTNRKAAYEALGQHLHEGDRHLNKSYAQYTRIINKSGLYLIKGAVVDTYKIVRLPLDTKHTKD